MEGCTTWRRTLAQCSPSESWVRQLWVPWVKTSRSRPWLTLEYSIWSTWVKTSRSRPARGSSQRARRCPTPRTGRAHFPPRPCAPRINFYLHFSFKKLSLSPCAPQITSPQHPGYWRLLPGNHPESWSHLWGYPCRERPVKSSTKIRKTSLPDCWLTCGVLLSINSASTLL